MKASAKSIIPLILSTVAGMSLCSLLAQPSWAQQATSTNNQADPLYDLRPNQQNGDPFSTRGDGANSFSVLSIMQRLSQGGNNYDSDAVNHNLDDEAAKLRAAQQKLLQGQQQSTPNR